MKVCIKFTIVILGLINFSCKHEIIDSSLKPVVYIHISHTRTNSNPHLDSIVEQIDYSNFDMLWLGGDLAYLTSKDDSTMLHVDSIFDLGNENTLWALGNHDYSDLERVQEFSNRSPYYAYNKNGISFMVIDTQDSFSSIVDEQIELLSTIVDTIQESSHLILLHHKLIWMNDGAYLEAQIDSTSNASFGNCFYCINPNNFYLDVYPKLLEVKEKGIEVLCIGGDIGMKANEFEYFTAEGIHFIASGISYHPVQNKALLFHHDRENKQLSWEYVLLNDL